LPANITFSQTVSLSAAELKTITISNLKVKNPQLWYPNGYGEQFLYDLELSFDEKKSVSDVYKTNFVFVKLLRIPLGHFDFICQWQTYFLRGGNWGLSESMLRLVKKIMIIV
jgi:hypothetical protein